MVYLSNFDLDMKEDAETRNFTSTLGNTSSLFGIESIVEEGGKREALSLTNTSSSENNRSPRLSLNLLSVAFLPRSFANARICLSGFWPTQLWQEVKKNDADHGAGSQAIPEVVCKKGPSIEGWKFPSPGGVSVSVGERSARAIQLWKDMSGELSPDLIQKTHGGVILLVSKALDIDVWEVLPCIKAHSGSLSTPIFLKRSNTSWVT
ncbi:hypothetical protein L6452_32530 [Arctium lappa]|uniref:Uncharacterized protein n=1 Tax=Arctium lappa TaxID=4217 RepID=A0ACB8Z576_ARCLA|nr:hypothetical protein L6452_32530 [Arctium lappa]